MEEKQIPGCQNLLEIKPKMSRVRLVIFSSPALLSLFADLMSKTTKHSVFPAKSSGVVSGFPLALGPCFHSDAHPCGSCFLSGSEKAPRVSSRCLPSSGSLLASPDPAPCLPSNPPSSQKPGHSWGKHEFAFNNLFPLCHHFSLRKPVRHLSAW